LYPRIKNKTLFFIDLAFLTYEFLRCPVIVHEILPSRFVYFLSRDKDQVKWFFEQFLVPSEERAQPPLRPVPLDCISKLFAGNDGHSGKSALVGEVNKNEIFSSVTFAVFIKMQKIFLLTYSFFGCELFIHQAASLFLPLRRRFLMMCWPPFLLIRTRKPWFFFRFLLFG
jgi:hypothetical protein